MDPRFPQAHKEARWAFWLAVAYIAAWALFAWLPDNQPGVTGLPHWFELSCLLIPLLFIFLCWVMLRVVFRDMSLEDSDDTSA